MLTRIMHENNPANSVPNITDDSELPPLPVKNRSFLCFLGTQALGAFNDNVFKQLLLLLAIPVVAVASASSEPQGDDQGKAITDKSFKAVGEAFNMKIDESKKNICDLISRIASVGQGR